jgi:hypothetical protein
MKRGKVSAVSLLIIAFCPLLYLQSSSSGLKKADRTAGEDLLSART